MNSEDRVLRFLVEDKREKFSIKEIIDGTGLTEDAVIGSITCLIEQGFAERHFGSPIEKTISINNKAVVELENRIRNQENERLSKKEKISNISRNRISSVCAIIQIPFTLYAAYDILLKIINR